MAFFLLLFKAVLGDNLISFWIVNIKFFLKIWSRFYNVLVFFFQVPTGLYWNVATGYVKIIAAFICKKKRKKQSREKNRVEQKIFVNFMLSFVFVKSILETLTTMMCVIISQMFAYNSEDKIFNSSALSSDMKSGELS